MANAGKVGVLVVGLGNPGPDYANTRHNAGWMVLDVLAQRMTAPFGRSPWEGEAAKVNAGQMAMVLLKPLTWMNLSGKSVAPAMRDLGLGPARVVVVSDEVQLPVGRLKLSTGGSDGGHNGLASVMAELGTPGFRRLRIGVGQGAPGQMRDWVLSPFGESDRALLMATLELAADTLVAFARLGGDESAWLKASAEANSKRRQPLEIELARQREAEAAKPDTDGQNAVEDSGGI